jgi:uncharacterized membrane protein YgcG
MNRRNALPFALACGLVLAGRAAAVAPVVHDAGGFFSKEAVKKADEQIRDLDLKYGMDLLIETFQTVPDDRKEKLKGLTGEERDRFYTAWAKEIMEAQVARGVLILVTRTPAHLHIEISPKYRSVFDRQAFGKLREMLLSDFREKHFDEGLEAAIKFVRQRLEAAGK